MSQNKKTKLSTIIGAFCGIALMLIVFVVKPYFSSNNDGINKQLVAIANEMNQTCPMTVDSETQMDNVLVLPENTIQYNYTLVNFDRADIDPTFLQNSIEPGAISNMKTNPDMKYFRDNKVTLAYNYVDRNGEFILKFLVSPDMYLQ